MRSKRRYNSVIFDYDGTLHDCLAIYAPAFRAVHEDLVERGISQPRVYSDEEIGSFLGLNPFDMWTSYNPALTDGQREELIDSVARHMEESVHAGKARLYPGILEQLQMLKDDGYTLIFLSNCKDAYMRLHRETFGLDRYFSAYYTAEGCDNIPKHEIFELFADDFDRDYVVVGDRFHDLDIARRHSLPSVGCAYGYGAADELADASVLIDSPDGIAEAVRSLG